MDQDGSLHISYDEWRDFLLLAPSDLHGILKYWRHSTVSRIPKLDIVNLFYTSVTNFFCENLLVNQGEEGGGQGNYLLRHECNGIQHAQSS